ncbi:hypothetical protein L8P27_02625 [Enterobacter asburiae]|uniref:hypothetical protein n=1 Tax=Enterobacter asburiae TaxID=61645 RepID=UPI002002D6B5|nr:hypothetical protein [Enterobacter asburiae]MCK7226756.1 hypothetical protein [Enterobacter asburiae]
MNMKVVHTHQSLQLRVEDFFDSSEERKKTRAFINALVEQTQAWIFGGMVRDIGLYGPDGFTSDIDLVIDWSHQNLTKALSALHIHQFTINKLGGLRFHYNGLDFDIWCIQDTWAFKNQKVKYENSDSLLKTTLMSWDSVLYDVKRKKVISTESYLQDLQRRRLELVLQETPNELGSVIRILRTIYNKQVEILGPQICDYLLHALRIHSCELLRQYEYSRYQKYSFSEGELQLLKENLLHAKSGRDTKIRL